MDNASSMYVYVKLKCQNMSAYQWRAWLNRVKVESEMYYSEKGDFIMCNKIIVLTIGHPTTPF